MITRVELGTVLILRNHRRGGGGLPNDYASYFSYGENRKTLITKGGSGSENG